MDLLSSLELSSQFQNVTYLQNTFIATFLASLAATTIRDILGEFNLLSHSFYELLDQKFHQPFR